MDCAVPDADSPAAAADSLDVSDGGTGDAQPNKPRLKTRACPGCGVQMPAEAFFCVHCGLDQRSGRRVQTTVVRRRSSGPAFAAVPRILWFLCLVVASVLLCTGIAFGLCYLGHCTAVRMKTCAGGRVTGIGTQDVKFDHADIFDGFALPATNTFVKVRFNDGGKMEGRLIEVTEDTVLIESGGVTAGCLRKAMTAASRIQFFRDDYAAYRREQMAATDAGHKSTGGSGGVPVSSVVTERVVCPCCGGEGYYMIRRMPHKMDMRQQCALCLGRGEKIVTHGQHESVCPDCRGWGATWNEAPRTPSLERGATIGKYKAIDTDSFSDVVRRRRPCYRCFGHGVLAVKNVPVEKNQTEEPRRNVSFGEMLISFLDRSWHWMTE